MKWARNVAFMAEMEKCVQNLSRKIGMVETTWET